MKPKFIPFLFILPLFLSTSFTKNDAFFTGINFSFRAEILKQINRVRTRGCNCGNIYMPAVPAVTWNEQLATAAAAHATDMATNHYFSHESLNGAHLHDRFEKAGYQAAGFERYAIGENIAAGQQSIEQVCRDWLQSETHCKNLMNPSFKEVGASVYNYYWVEDFGGRFPFRSNGGLSK